MNWWKWKKMLNMLYKDKTHSPFYSGDTNKLPLNFKVYRDFEFKVFLDYLFLLLLLCTWIMISATQWGSLSIKLCNGRLWAEVLNILDPSACNIALCHCLSSIPPATTTIIFWIKEVIDHHPNTSCWLLEVPYDWFEF